MTQIDLIKERHSVRVYKPDKIEQEKVALLNEKINELNEAGNIHLQLIEDTSKTYNKLVNKAMGQKSAPAVIACAGKEVEMALLAPTAVNQQKFLIRLNNDDSVEFIDKGGMFSKVDLGIVKCHFEIGADRKVFE